MSRFAKIDEEVIKRQPELTGEELRLYCLIVFHTWTNSGICNKNLQEICQIHRLNYNHTTERYKNLRKEIRPKMRKGEKERILNMKSPWCENTKKGIRPLVGMRTPKNGILEVNDNSEKRSSELRKAEFQTPKNGVLEGEKLRKTELHIRNIEPFKDESFSIVTPHGENAAGVSVENGKSLSKFSIEECLSYAHLCQSKGDDIRNPRALALTLHKTGAADVFIEAALYPEQSVIPAPPVEYSDEVFYEMPEAEPLTDDEKQSSLVLLRSMLRESSIENLETFSVNFTRDDWAWLKGELQNAR